MQRFIASVGLVSFVVALGVVSLAATQTFTNDTGSAVTGIKITFSDMVWVTEWDRAIFTSESPVGVATEITFSGGTLPALATFSVTWGEAYVAVTGYTWLTGSGTVAGSPTASATNGPLTYEQIMSQIAHYPGPDEPLYQPKDGEQIWLTDLEGHADIYDNDSIKINYAPGFDKKQIARIDVYRNGVKLRFVPAMFDVLTNDQMKTFDGNPQENTPRSSHTDHAVVGYRYSFRFYKLGSSVVDRVLSATVQNPVSFSGEYLMANISHNWWSALYPGQFYGLEPAAFFADVKALGFRGVQVEINLFMDDMSSNEVFPIYEYDPQRMMDYQRTATDDEIKTILQYIKAAGLDAEVRIEFTMTQDLVRSHPNENITRELIQPRSVATWFENYAALCEHYAKLAEENHAEYFCPMVELQSMGQYTDRVEALLTRVDAVFSGTLAVSEATNIYGLGFELPEWHVGRFWGYDSMVIGMNSWGLPLETQEDQRYSTVLERFVAFWRPFVEEYRRLYPGHKIVFEEIGLFNYDGTLFGYPHEVTNQVRDDQEVADYWAAAFGGLRALGMDGIAVWNIGIRDPNVFTGSSTLNQPPLIYTITSFIQ